MLEIKNVSFSAQGRKILDDINLVIPDGKLICLTGPNGGGKTTLAKMIAGVEKPDEGQILLDGMDIVPLDPTERARGIWRNAYLTAALELRCGNQAINAPKAGAADMKAGMTAEMMLDFIKK